MGNCCQGKDLEQEFSHLNNIRTPNEEVGDSKCFEHTEFDANLQDTVFFEGSSHLGCSTKFGTQNPNTDKVNNDFLDLKQKYEILSEYISKSSDVQNHEFNGSVHNDILLNSKMNFNQNSISDWVGNWSNLFLNSVHFLI